MVSPFEFESEITGQQAKIKYLKEQIGKLESKLDQEQSLLKKWQSELATQRQEERQSSGGAQRGRPRGTGRTRAAGGTPAQRTRTRKTAGILPGMPRNGLDD